MRHVLFAVGFVTLLTGCPSPISIIGPTPACTANRYSMMLDSAMGPRVPSGVTFSPDGKTLAVGSVDCVYLRDLELKLLNKFTTDFAAEEIVFAPDGRKLFAQGSRSISNGSRPPFVFGRACIIDRVSGTCDPSDRGQCSSDGLSIVRRTETQGKIQIRATFNSSEPPSTTSISTQNVGVMALTSDRRRVAFVEEDSKIRVLDLTKDNTTSVRDVPGRSTISESFSQLDGHKHRIQQLQFTPDGRHLISASGAHFGEPVEVIVWDLAQQRVQRRLPDLPNRFSRFYVSNDGRYLAVGTVSIHTTLTLWDLRDGKKIRTVENLAWKAPAAFSPDSTRLALVDSSGAIRIEEIAADSPALPK